MFLEVQLPEFLGEEDERVFFSWLQRVSSTKRVDGKGLKISIVVDIDNLSDQDVMSYIQLFYRYGMKGSELAKLQTGRNRNWFFDNKRAYWSSFIFGESAS